jgi:hypothetical protein
LKILTTTETFDFAPSTRVYTDEGFLRVSGKAARTGVYQYLASELQLTDRDPNEVVNVYRPPEEVFNNDSLASYANVDVTNNHPSELVSAKTYRNVSVGTVSGARQDGDFVSVDMLIKDECAIKDVEGGKSQLSPGYTAVYVQENGTAPCGTNYEFKQTGIDVNHVAIVQRGRGGAQVRIDDKDGVKTMTVKVMLDSGKALEVADEAQATLVQDHMKALSQQVTDANAKTSKVEAERDMIKTQLDEAVKATSDEAIQARVKAVADAQAEARKIAGDKFTCDSVNVTEIKRAALCQVNDSIKWAEKDEAYIAAAFDMAMSGTTVQVDNSQQLQQLTVDMQTKQQEPKVSAYDAHKASLSNAWKGGK